MKKNFYCLIFALIFLISNIALAEEIPASVYKDINIQNHICDVGFKLLNANKIEKRMTFVYTHDANKKVKLKNNLSRKEVIIFDKTLNYIANDDELAALLALSIGKTIEAYKGFFTSSQSKLAPKKFELLYDKKAVDYMVKAGYNPVALITLINKAFPQEKGILAIKGNSTSQRLANIYEYIYMNYPYFLKNNPYLYSQEYQNFLLTSIRNRNLLQNKIKSGSKKTIIYE